MSHADTLAERIRNILRERRVPFLVESHTNQIFPILPDDVLERMREKYTFTYQERVDETHSAVRFCTSWATEPAAVEQLCRDIEELL